MKYTVAIIATAAAFSVFATEAWAGRVYFVRSEGSNSNNGYTWATAWQTSAKVQSTITAGDTVIWGRGIFAETRINPPAGGSNSVVTVYACSTWYTGTTPAEKLAGRYLTVWTGAKAVTGWVDTLIGSATVQKAIYSPGVYCQTDNGQGIYGQCFAARQQGCDSMLLPLHNSFTKADLGTCPNGYFWNGGDAAGNVVYVKGYHGALGSSDTVWVSCDAPLAFDFNPATYVRVWGMQIEMGHNGAVTYRQSNVQNTSIEHCMIRRSGVSNGGNPAAVYSEGQGTLNERDNRLLSDSILGWGVMCPNSIRTAPDAGMEGHGAIINIYNQHHFVIESCYVGGPGSHGIDFKLSKTSEAPNQPWEGNTVKFSVIDGSAKPPGAENNGPASGVYYIFNIGNDSVYGNIIKNWNCGILRWGEKSETSNSGMRAMYFNNTFYNIRDEAILLKQTTASPNNDGPVLIRYNVFANPSAYANRAFIFSPNGLSLQVDTTYSDFNIWWQGTGNFSADCWGGTERGNTWTDWQTQNGDCSNKTFDVNSNQSDPGFANPTNGDFSRPSASVEMTADFGGKHWSIFGAIQPSAAADAVILPVLPLRKR